MSSTVPKTPAELEARRLSRPANVIGRVESWPALARAKGERAEIEAWNALGWTFVTGSLGEFHRKRPRARHLGMDKDISAPDVAALLEKVRRYEHASIEWLENQKPVPVQRGTVSSGAAAA